MTNTLPVFEQEIAISEIESRLEHWVQVQTDKSRFTSAQRRLYSIFLFEIAILIHQSGKPLTIFSVLQHACNPFHQLIGGKRISGEFELVADQLLEVAVNYLWSVQTVKA